MKVGDKVKFLSQQEGMNEDVIYAEGYEGKVTGISESGFWISVDNDSDDEPVFCCCSLEVIEPALSGLFY